MSILLPGAAAPAIPGVRFGPSALFFYKVTCPVCQMAAPYADRFEDAYPGRITGIGQDSQTDLEEFSKTYRLSFPSVADTDPYALSDAYGIEAVPTLFLVGEEGKILDAAESWDREGFNRISRGLADLIRTEYLFISEEGDGLPAFRPG
ncbi:MAG: TlpA disulfide reductase family protein [Actinomycetota bacterium]